MALLLLLFIVVPAVELALLIEIGGRIGTVNTLLLIVLTGVLGASLARWQGLWVLQAIQAETAAGRLPAARLMDGVIILLASALLVTPGLLTDVVGFLCLVPAGRALIRGVLRRRLARAVREGRIVMAVHVDDVGGPRGPAVYDVEVEPEDEPPPRRRLP